MAFLFWYQFLMNLSCQVKNEFRTGQGKWTGLRGPFLLVNGTMVNGESLKGRLGKIFRPLAVRTFFVRVGNVSLECNIEKIV